MNKALRFIVLALLLVAATVAQEETAQHEPPVADVIQETIIDATQEPEPVQEQAPPTPEQVEETAEAAQEAVEETVQEVVDTVAETTENTKSKLSGFVDGIVGKSKSLVDKVKSVSKKDAKKIAAAVVGIWGVSVGVGYLTNQAATTPANPTIAKRK